MPATSSRISVSSSTIRISSADSAPFLLMPVTWGWARAGHTREGQTYEGTALARCSGFIGRRRVLEGDAAVVVFHDLLDDRDPEHGAPLAIRHVRLGQAVTVFARPSDAIVQ